MSSVEDQRNDCQYRSSFTDRAKLGRHDGKLPWLSDFISLFLYGSHSWFDAPLAATPNPLHLLDASFLFLMLVIIGARYASVSTWCGEYRCSCLQTRDLHHVLDMSGVIREETLGPESTCTS